MFHVGTDTADGFSDTKMVFVLRTAQLSHLLL